MRSWWSRENEAGSITVLAAAVLFLAGVLVLVSVDLLRVVQARARAQTAADAAALAAAQEIALPSGRAPEEVAADYAERNGGALVSCQCDPHASEATVEVEVPADLVFVGADRIVRASARAVIEGAQSHDASTMAADAESHGSSLRPTPSPDVHGPAGPARQGHGSGRLHAGQAGPPARLPMRSALSVRDLRRPP